MNGEVRANRNSDKIQEWECSECMFEWKSTSENSDTIYYYHLKNKHPWRIVK